MSLVRKVPYLRAIVGERLLIRDDGLGDVIDHEKNEIDGSFRSRGD